MKMKKLSAMILASVMVLSVAGCGAKTENTAGSASEAPAEEVQSEPAEQEVQEETDAQAGENPIKAYEGAYKDENGSEIYLLFEAGEEPDSVIVSIGFPEETAYTYWEITGTIKDNVITYKNGYKYSMDWGAPDQEDVTEEEVYNDGTGTFEISSDAKVTWKDDKEDAGNGLVFVWDEEMNTMISEQMEGADYDFIDGAQNPTMNWAGPYVDTNKKERTMLLYSGSEGTNDCMVSVTDTPSPEKMVTWLMTGVFDEETMSIKYTDAVKTEYELDAEGNAVSENTIYENGTGSFIIDSEEQTLTWADDVEDAGNGSVFTFQFDYGEEGDEEAWEEEPAEETP